MNIQFLNLPGLCLGCADPIRTPSGNLPHLVSIDFRMADYSTATYTFCRKCALGVSPDDFWDIQGVLERGWFITVVGRDMLSAWAESDTGRAMEAIRRMALSDWQVFMGTVKHLNSVARETMEISLSSLPILAIARYRVPTEDGAALVLKTKSEIADAA